MSRCRLTICDPQALAPERDWGPLEELLDRCLADADIDAASLTVLWVDDAQSSALHAAHFADPDSTDVMTFPDGEVDPETGLPHLGDLAVNLALADRLGPDKHPASPDPGRDEAILYVLHGLLHLLGYDDQDPAERQAMWTRQRELLATVGIAISAKPEA